ncbi:MAG TPA: hypothetical protein IAD47_00675 [Candidatus Limihabitans stercoravium]|nr:hypothetical protein [Candidatus Limihabitans stercoravium]
MKFLDNVKVIKDREEYKKQNIFAEMVGTIIDAEIRDGRFNVIFIDERVKDKNFMASEKNFLSLKDDIVYPIKIEDLVLVKDNHCKDEMILDSIPNKSKDWWCKVESGYIVNLNGKRKNKIPYDYNS